jgi:demethylmenaquinone methyltransferase/2-methoxy-6-polyprenyl-1,4-benzoquinol methylase
VQPERKGKALRKPQIEVTGLEARFYDYLVLIGSLGYYNKLIKQVIDDMDIGPADRILDLGAGTGKNALLMLDYLSDEGSITALEIGKEMRKLFQKKCGKYSNVYLENRRIEKPLSYENEYHKVFISFVLHGFQHPERENIIENAFKALVPGGRILIFDWNEFDLNDVSLYLRFFIRHVECKPAIDFIQRDLKSILTHHGFRNASERVYMNERIRLLSAEKIE